MTNKEAIKRIQDIIAYTGLTIPTSLNDIEALEMAIKALEEERQQGEWICKGTETGALGIQYEIKQCNKCGFEHSLCIPKNFCPNCGADMRGKEE